MRKHFLPMFSLVFVFCACQRQDDLKPLVEEGDMTFVSPKNAGNSLSNELAMVALTSDTHISVEEAQELALSTAAQMREVEGILTKSPLQIASVEVVANNERKPYVATKSGETPEQGDVYIINFANNQGYVVTSADSRVPGVLAYNSYGNLGKEIDNPGQAIMFSYMQDYIEQERENFEKNKETLKIQAEEHIFAQLPKEKQKELIEKGYFDEKGKRVRTKNSSEGKEFNSHEEYRDWYCSVYGHNVRLESHFTREQEEVFDKKAREELERGYNKYGVWKTKKALPLLKTLWGQSGDYNDKVNVVCGNDQAAVGCVATAVGQIMAFHKKPAIFKGREMHWDEMTKVDAGHMFSNIYSKSVRWNSTAVEDIQHLLARLGDSDLLDMDYGCESGSNIGKAQKTLRRLGYEVLIVEGNVWEAIREIRRGRPVYFRGCSEEIKNKFLGITIWKDYDKCHAWVIDGWTEWERPVTTYRVFSCYDDEPLLSYETYSRDTMEFVHHNFGWGEDGNYLNGNRHTGSGWYNPNILNAHRGAASNTYKSSERNDYKYGNEMLFIK